MIILPFCPSIAVDCPAMGHNWSTLSSAYLKWQKTAPECIHSMPPANKEDISLSTACRRSRRVIWWKQRYQRYILQIRRWRDRDESGVLLGIRDAPITSVKVVRCNKSRSVFLCKRVVLFPSQIAVKYARLLSEIGSSLNTTTARRKTLKSRAFFAVSKFVIHNKCH